MEPVDIDGDPRSILWTSQDGLLWEALHVRYLDDQQPFLLGQAGEDVVFASLVDRRVRGAFRRVGDPTYVGEVPAAAVDGGFLARYSYGFGDGAAIFSIGPYSTAAGGIWRSVVRGGESALHCVAIGNLVLGSTVVEAARMTRVVMS